MRGESEQKKLNINFVIAVPSCAFIQFVYWLLMLPAWVLILLLNEGSEIVKSNKNYSTIPFRLYGGGFRVYIFADSEEKSLLRSDDFKSKLFSALFTFYSQKICKIFLVFNWSSRFWIGSYNKEKQNLGLQIISRNECSVNVGIKNEKQQNISVDCTPFAFTYHIFVRLYFHLWSTFLFAFPNICTVNGRS